MELSRRDVFKLGLLGTAALAPAGQCVVALGPPTRESARPGPIAGARATRLPRPTGRGPDGDQAHRPREVDQPRPGAGVRGGLRRLPRDRHEAGVPAGAAGSARHAVLGLQRRHPRPDIHERGRPALVRHVNGLAGKYHPTQRDEPQTSVHLHGSARCPSTTATPATTCPGHTRTTATRTSRTRGRSGTTTTACTTRLRTPTWGLAAQYHLHDDQRARPASRRRRYDSRSHPRHDVRHRRPAHLRRQQPSEL